MKASGGGPRLQALTWAAAGRPAGADVAPACQLASTWTPLASWRRRGPRLPAGANVDPTPASWRPRGLPATQFIYTHTHTYIYR
jgi:hypothetical protein